MKRDSFHEKTRRFLTNSIAIFKSCFVLQQQGDFFTNMFITVLCTHFVYPFPGTLFIIQKKHIPTRVTTTSRIGAFLNTPVYFHTRAVRATYASLLRRRKVLRLICGNAFLMEERLLNVISPFKQHQTTMII